MSATEQGLLQAILESPADDDPRLIYADWLDEQGQGPHAEFIRTQIRLGRMPEFCHRSPHEGCERCACVRREEELLSRHGGEWLRSLPGEGWQWCGRVTWRRPEEMPVRPRLACFQRGFIGCILLATDDFIEIAPLLPERHPLQRVQLSDRWPDADGVGFVWRPESLCNEEPGRISYCLLNALALPDGGRWETESGALEALSRASLAWSRVCLHQLGHREEYTTAQVAKICHVSPTTAAKWFDSGKLHGRRVAGSQARRVPRDSLVRFLRENGMLGYPTPLPVPPPAPPTAEEIARQDLALAEEIRGKDWLTTEEVGRLCRVAPRVVVKWIKGGLLTWQRNADGRRLVPREGLARFLRQTLSLVAEGV
jgi:uncharacterized protein (TIGR02996 family)